MSETPQCPRHVGWLRSPFSFSIQCSVYNSIQPIQEQRSEFCFLMQNNEEVSLPGNLASAPSFIGTD